MSVSENLSVASAVTPAPNGKPRFHALDGWRFWAALTILLEHCGYIAYFSPKPALGMLPITSYLTLPFFFMLSGFMAAVGADGSKWNFFSTVDYYLRRLGIEVDKNGDLSFDTTLFREIKFTRHTL